jgi:gamma-glutamyltranspeptidase
MPSAHAACLAMLAPVMTMNEGARIYAPGGALLETGGRLLQPGLVPALELIADEGGASVYHGSIADALLELVEARGGLVTREDLESYEARWDEPVEVAYAGTRVATRAGLSGVPATLARLPRLGGATERERIPALVEVLDSASVGAGQHAR